MITPNSEIRLLAGVPMDPTYQHTLYWNSAVGQRDAMGNFSIGTFGKQYYQRVSKNTLRLKTDIAAVYQANYLMFKNAATVPGTNPTQYAGYPDKWFYAFVLNVEYVNEQVVEITYEIDVIQTWFFELKASLKPCFIERQHTETDGKGEHRVPEPIKPGEFWFTETKLKAGSIDDVFNEENMAPRIIICSTFKKVNGEWDFSPGGMKAGMYTGVNINMFSDDTTANNFINDATDEMKSEGLVCCYQLPKALAPNTDLEYDVVSIAGNITKYSPGYTPTGWTPKNNKLYSYPYYGLYVVSSDGKSVEYNMEDFTQSNTECFFDLLSVPTAKPEIALIPKDYKRKGAVGGVRNYNEMLTIENVPYCAFAIDSFKAWIAQNKVRILTGFVSDAATIAGSAAIASIPGVSVVGGSMAIASSTTQGIKSTINTLGEIVQASKMPPQLNGQQNSSLLNATRNLKFRFYIYYLQQEYMEIVDDFFTMYGYAIKKVAVPKLNARPHWTYIKTNGCNIRTKKAVGGAGDSIPARDIVKIKEIFDNGVTFWVEPENVGNYTLDNSPSSTP